MQIRIRFRIRIHIPSPMIHRLTYGTLQRLRLRMVGSAAAGFLLAACSNQILPDLAVAQPRLKRQLHASVNDDKLAAALLEVQQQPLAKAAGPTEQVLLALQAKAHLHDWKEPLKVQGKSGSWEISFDTRPVESQGKPEWSPFHFDRLIPASYIKLDDYQQVLAGDGAGVPVILAFEDIARLRRERSFRPGNGLYVPGTAILEFGERRSTTAPVPVRLRIFNTFEQRTANLRGGSEKLAWNTTASLEANLNNPYIVKNGLDGLLRPDRRANDLGIFGMTPYDSKKIPVVFVHGLNSDPHIWKNAINEIHGNPELHRRYHPLLFLYPTGMSVPGAATRLRESLSLYRQKWDPEQDDPGFEQTVVVGHSMGGLLTRLQVIDPGNELERAFFTKPISEIPWIAKNDRKVIESSLKFKPQPFVKRVIFVAVPHQGSRVADVSIVRFAVRLIHLPLNTAQYVGKALTADTSMLNPALLKYNNLGLRSVDMLSPEHPYFQALQSCKIHVPHHSIIGDRGKNNGTEGSDGVVPYWSSHVKGADSEKIVPYGHSCTAEPETVAEILRILKLHLEK
jgi:pimeloyl-ACP methyl ester carboxylesterase